MDETARTEPQRGTICVVGPVLPFRGGISHYNSMLFRQLRSSGVTAKLFSFSRQYPKLLYPGADDRDPALKDHVEPGVDYSIDSINPFTWWKTAKSIAETTPDLVVFHWWTIFWAPCFWFIANILKRRRIRVAIICHNLSDHDAGRIKSWISRRFVGVADAYLVHSTEHAQVLRASYKRALLVQHPIPVYGHYPPPKSHLRKRGRLELLFFGFIRPYKGLDVLIEALKRLGDDEVYLTVIGEPWGGANELLEQAKNCPNIELHLGYISDEEAASHFERADFVVLPYRKATGSAVASVAFNYDKPIIASQTGGLVDVVIAGQTGKLFPPGDEVALTSLLGSTCREEAAELSDGVQKFKAKNNWSSLCEELMKLAAPKTPREDQAP